MGISTSSIITSITNPFDHDNELRNVSKKCSITRNVVEGIRKCIEAGEQSYHDTISTNRNIVTPKPSSAEQAKETLQAKVIATWLPRMILLIAFRYIAYARERQ